MPPKSVKRVNVTTSLFALLQMTRAMSDTTAPAAPAPAVEMDELEKYLQRPQLPVTDGFNVLGCGVHTRGSTQIWSKW